MECTYHPRLNSIPQRGTGKKMQNSLLHPFMIFISIILLILPSSSATIFLVSDMSNETLVAINDMPARFVPERYAFYGMQGYVVYADPPTACTKVKPPPKPYTPGTEYPISFILLAKRSPDCHFQQKIENAQNSGYSAIIIHNVGSNDTEIMGVEDPMKLMIYATFIGEFDGLTLKNYTYPNPYFIRIRNDFSVNNYLVPFAVIVGFCIIVMLLFMVRLLWQQVVRWYRERRRSRRRKLPASALKKLPVHKWTKGDPYETCAVCLDDFVEQDKIRILPCYHGYHVVCIDRWLTKGRRVCPICKRKVIVADEQFSDSDTETEDENAPLIPTTSASQSAPPSGASTFVQNQLNIRIIESLGSRRLLSRMYANQQSANSQNPVNDSDSSSISSGTSHSIEENADQSTITARPSTSTGRPYHSRVHAEVHQSTSMLRKILELKKQNRSDSIANDNLNDECVHQSLDSNSRTINEEEEDDSTLLPVVDLKSESVLRNASTSQNDQLVVVVADPNNRNDQEISHKVDVEDDDDEQLATV